MNKNTAPPKGSHKLEHTPSGQEPFRGDLADARRMIGPEADPAPVRSFPGVAEISFVPHYSAPPKTISLGLVPELLASRVMSDLVEPLRRRFEAVFAQKGMDAAKKSIREAKTHLPAVLPCGVFSIRKIAGLERYAGVVPLDFDAFADRAGAAAFKARLCDDPHILLVFLSPSGRGVKAFLRVPDRKHSTNYEMAVCYCLDQWDVRPDPSGKDVSRLCFLSFDPTPHWNPAAEILQFNHYAWMRDTGFQPSSSKRSGQKHDAFDYDEDDAARNKSDNEWSNRQANLDLVSAAVAAIDEQYASDYETWLHSGFALHWWGRRSGRTEDALKLWHTFSAKCPPKYNRAKSDAKWDGFDRAARWVDADAVTIGTLLHYAKESGFELPSNRERLRQNPNE